MRALDVPWRGSRTCLTCFETLPEDLEHFPYDPMGRGGVRPHCLPCWRARRRETYAHNADHVRRQMRERYAARAAHYRQALVPRGPGPDLFDDTKD